MPDDIYTTTENPIALGVAEVRYRFLAHRRLCKGIISVQLARNRNRLIGNWWRKFSGRVKGDGDLSKWKNFSPHMTQFSMVKMRFREPQLNLLRSYDLGTRKETLQFHTIELTTQREDVTHTFLITTRQVIIKLNHIIHANFDTIQ